MKTFFVLLWTCAPLAAQAVQPVLLDLQALDLVPVEVAPFVVAPRCGPRGAARAPECALLEAVAPRVRFTLLDPKAVEGLEHPDKPMTEILGRPMSAFEARATTPADLCGRRIVVPEATDQFGGRWKMTPYMFLNEATGKWTHEWTVSPEFAGYAAAVSGGRASSAQPLTHEQLRARRPALGRLLEGVLGLFD